MKLANLNAPEENTAALEKAVALAGMLARGSPRPGYI